MNAFIKSPSDTQTLFTYPDIIIADIRGPCHILWNFFDIGIVSNVNLMLLS